MAGRDYRHHVLGFYNRFARLYDLGEPFRRGTRRKAVEMSGWQSGDRVLDVCTGTGEQALTFARLGAEVVGIDLARGTLRCASKKAAPTRPGWMEADATALCFPDGAFDVSTVSFALHHMPEPTQRRVLGEVARVTRKSVVIIEPHAPANPRLHALWTVFLSCVDESEHLAEWVRQDFSATCRAVGLRVEAVHVATLGIHRLTLCAPARAQARHSARG